MNIKSSDCDIILSENTEKYNITPVTKPENTFRFESVTFRARKGQIQYEFSYVESEFIIAIRDIMRFYAASTKSIIELEMLDSGNPIGVQRLHSKVELNMFDINTQSGVDLTFSKLEFSKLAFLVFTKYVCKYNSQINNAVESKYILDMLCEFLGLIRKLNK